ncbi:MAG: InlB B-repeat-containing protein, partial [Oscillospiraceae bacterium]|nr:InlB B-repeat-containing protein [Oscillospiraceae bacterium]
LAGGELELDEVRAITDWVDYNGTFKIDPNNRYVVYAKVTDNTGNILYINSDGIVLDNIAPTLEGIENGKTYYGDLTVIKSDEQFYDIKMVTLDGEPMGFAEGTYGLIPADNAEHIVVVEDHAGNKTTYTVTVMKNYTVTYKADGETVSTETVGHGKDATLPAVPAKDGYVGKWDSDGKNITGDTTITVVYTEIHVVKPNEVKPEDKTDLEDTKAKLEEELKDDSYTDNDKKDIQDAIDDIDDALEVIGNAEAVEDLIDKLPENITKNDEDAIKAADDAYNALSDYEKSLVDEDAKKALDDAKAALAELNKPADTDSPQTGDNSNLGLWVFLLVLSCCSMIALIVIDKKRKIAK